MRRGRPSYWLALGVALVCATGAVSSARGPAVALAQARAAVSQCGAGLTVAIHPQAASALVGSSDTVIAVITGADGLPVGGAEVEFRLLSGPSTGVGGGAGVSAND